MASWIKAVASREFFQMWTTAKKTWASENEREKNESYFFTPFRDSNANSLQYALAYSDSETAEEMEENNR